jgi:putative ABC transport system permease protein
MSFSALDFKIGLRMLARYPGLSIVGMVAVAVAIALGTIYFEAVDKFRNPRLPMAGADRVVSLLNWNAKGVEPDSRLLNDFAAWRKGLTKVTDLGAAITFQRNLETQDRSIEPVYGAEVTASAFSIMGTPPLLGRTLAARDEQVGEPPVVVLGHSLWSRRFDADSQVVGKTVKLGSVTATIVGVMPEGFAFPVNHKIWTPLRQDGSLIPPGTGPSVRVFGRLAPGVSLDEAQAELAVVGARAASVNPETHKDLRPRVVPYEKPLLEGGEAGFIGRLMYLANTIFLMLLTIVCTNVATLVFARTATRKWEITVRNALGASRGRIIAQLFIEALVLVGGATVVGLFIARVAMGYGLAMVDASDAVPFWYDASLSWKTFIYAGFLTLFAAAIIGILPALRVTRGSLHDAMRSQGAGSGLRFGWFWTTVIVVQVAITVAFMPLAAGGIFESNRFQDRAAGIGADRFLTAGVALDREDHALDTTAFNARARLSISALEQRLATEPGVEGVAFSDRLPVEDQFKYGIEVDTLTGATGTGIRVSTLVHVSSGFFGAYGTSIMLGRNFVPLDFETTGRVLIVNQSFARHVFGDRNPVGQRVRIREGEVNLGTGDDWYEIVGMVKDFGWQLPRPEEQSAMYLPSLPTGRARTLALRVRDPEAFANRLRTVAAEVDPSIRLTDVHLLTKAGGGEAQINWTLTAVAGLVAFMVLLLSTMGIHSLMSLTVARRTREIGVRTALGAQPGSIIRGIFGRAFFQISLGLLAGSGLVALVGLESTRQVLLLLGADAIMLIAGLTACAVPLRRALGIEPTEALRAEA